MDERGANLKPSLWWEVSADTIERRVQCDRRDRSARKVTVRSPWKTPRLSTFNGVSGPSIGTLGIWTTVKKP